MRDLTARELGGHPATAPLQQLAQRIGGRLEAASDLVTDLARLGGVLPEARRQRHRIDVAELVREESDALAARAARSGIVLKRRIPDALEASTIPSLARLLVRLLLEAAIASTPPGGSVECALIADPEQGRARLLVQDGGPSPSKEDLARIAELDFERTLVGRESELELLAAFAIASELATRLELLDVDGGGLLARVWL
jgi:signal transduction histidine kinase